MALGFRFGLGVRRRHAHRVVDHPEAQRGVGGVIHHGTHDERVENLGGGG